MIEHRLPQQLDIRCIAEAHRLLRGVLSTADDADIVLDAEAVERIDTAGVQLLAALLRDSASRIVLVHASASVVAAFEALGLAHLLAPRNRQR